MSESQALVTAIGEYTIDLLGRDNLTGLQVTLNPRDAAAFMCVALVDRSDAAQKRAIKEMFDVERVFQDEIVLTFVFVDEIPVDATAEISTAPQFSLV